MGRQTGEVAIGMRRRRPREAVDAGDVLTAAAAPRIAIERISPCVEGGRYPARAVVGQAVVISADIFMDGHDKLGAELLWREDADGRWQVQPMQPLGNDRWQAHVTPQRTGMHAFRLRAWFDRWATYRSEVDKKYRAGVSIELEIGEGIAQIRAAAESHPESAAALGELLQRLQHADEQAAVAILLDDHTAECMHCADTRPFLLESEPSLAVEVERRAAGFAAWYELFPRSQSHSADVHGSFDDVIARLPAIHAMGFDVLYFPPIHPIGRTHRKGRNNSLQAAPDDPGSPYAIGSQEGGHDAVHPELGGLDGFQRLRSAAADYGIELALDFAIQCSPDHPWLREHPQWFQWRSDGSIRYAENPPKKYEDIVNVDFYSDAAVPDLWLALRDVVLFWVGQGVRIFRVDNPHTKPLPFWEWLIRDVRAREPDTIFLSEAFTRPAMMYRLAKIGFTQSYTYFTWRNSRHELTGYLQELADGAPKDFFRPHFFVNTPDINPIFLHTSGRPGFVIRAGLAATLSGLWGVYSGFELCESEPVPGKEEYMHSEKYELRPRDWNAPGNIIGVITRLNHIRRDNPALHSHLGVRFHATDNDRVLCFSKATADRSNVLLVAISLDPQAGQHCHIELPLAELGLDERAGLEVEELMRGLPLFWHGRCQHWYLDPQELPLAIWRLRMPRPIR
jgi:starch synthase (maltosyl-transferring)